MHILINDEEIWEPLNTIICELNIKPKESDNISEEEYLQCKNLANKLSECKSELDKIVNARLNRLNK